MAKYLPVFVCISKLITHNLFENLLYIFYNGNIRYCAKVFSHHMLCCFSKGQSMTVSVLSAGFLQIWFHCISSVLGIVIMLNHSQSGAFQKEWHDELKPVCTFQHSWSNQFGQYRQHYWQKCSPKPGQTLHHVSLKAASTHSSISLQLFLSHIVDDWTQIFRLVTP